MSELIKNIKAAIRELPLTDSVHCYDYEIRTDDLHTLCDTLDALEAEHTRYKAVLSEIRDRMTWVVKACNIDRDAKHELESMLTDADDALSGKEQK